MSETITETVAIQVLGMFLSGVAGVVATIVYQHWNADRQRREQTFFGLARHSTSTTEFLLSLNEIPAVFFRRPLVMRAHQRMLEAKDNSGDFETEELRSLIRVIAADVGVKGASEMQLMHRFIEVSRPDLSRQS